MLYKQFGLVGYPLSHSFSKQYFTEKFKKQGLYNYRYHLFEVNDIAQLPNLLQMYPSLTGFNVTAPYKMQIIPYLKNLDSMAQKIGAVNTVKIYGPNHWVGYNTDYKGFKISLLRWVPQHHKNFKALILGTGGAAKAVQIVLEALNIPYKYVSRQCKKHKLCYHCLRKNPAIIAEHRLIIHCTPMGTYPNVEQFPNLPYAQITAQHWLYDLVYNPEKTIFLKKGAERGAQIKNGLEMLYLQAEKSYELFLSA